MKKFLNVKQTLFLVLVVSLMNLIHATDSTEKQRDFTFKYGNGVKSMEITFDPANFDRGGTGVKWATSTDTGNKNIVSVYSGLANSGSVAKQFKGAYTHNWQFLPVGEKFQMWHCPAFGSVFCFISWMNKRFTSLDFWVEGTMTINGQPVINSSNQNGFSWAHNGNNNGWIIANDKFVNVNTEDTGLTVATYNNGQTDSYCMATYEDKNYEVTISKGACSSRDLDFVFNYDGVNVTSVEFKNPYNPALSEGLLSYQEITSQSTKNKTTLTFNSQLNANSTLGKLFTDSYSCYSHCLNLNGRRIKSADDTKHWLDYWAEGDLYINNSRVVQTTGQAHPGFALAHEYHSTNWWIADNNGTVNMKYQKYYLLDLATEDGNNYCISGRKNSNYSVDVTLGKCNVPAQ